MDASVIEKVGVVGCGQMGSGITEVFLKSGYQVQVYEVTPECLAKGLKAINNSFTRAVDKGKLAAEEKEACLGRLSGAEKLEDLAACDLVIEAAVEDLALKKTIFAGLDACCKPETILASNTSSISITEIASATRRPGQVLGMHFFNPVPVMAFVELVNGVKTSPETLETARAVADKVGKTTAVVRDRPGFVVNLLLIPYLCDAIRWYDAGLATREEIDNGMRLACNHPMGPLALADLIGLDVVLFIQDVLYSQFGEARYAAPPVLRRMVSAGMLGRKCGQGFYTYTK